MNRKDQKGMDSDAFMDAMMKNSTRFWEGMGGQGWAPKEGAEAGEGDAFNPWEPWEPAMEAWKQFQETCSAESLTDSLKAAGTEGFKHFEEMAKGGWPNASSMGQDFASSFTSLGAPDMFAGKDMFKEIFKMMSGELNRLFSIPPLGLSRNYQGKMVELFETGNKFMLTLGEYMFLMFTPLEQAMKMVQATVKELTDEQRVELTPETVYDTWLKELEQGYFSLYRSEEYLIILKRLVAAMGEFNLARQNYMSDCLKFMGIPSESDLDDLYRDLYTVKKKLASLEKSVETMGAQRASDLKDIQGSPARKRAAKKQSGLGAKSKAVVDSSEAIPPAGRTTKDAKGATLDSAKIAGAPKKAKAASKKTAAGPKKVKAAPGKTASSPKKVKAATSKVSESPKRRKTPTKKAASPRTKTATPESKISGDRAEGPDSTLSASRIAEQDGTSAQKSSPPPQESAPASKVSDGSRKESLVSKQSETKPLSTEKRTPASGAAKQQTPSGKRS